MRVNFNVLGLTCDGGSRVICELANALVDHDCSVSITSASKLYLDWMDHKPLSKKVVVRVFKPSLLMRMFRKAYLTRNGWNYNICEVLTKNMPSCDVNIAAHSLLALPTLVSGQGKPVHFIQAYEPLIQYRNNDYLTRLSQYSYQLPMKKICVSKSLAEKVGGVNIGNGVDTTFYKPLPVEKNKNLVMGINTRPTLPWKGGTTLEQVFCLLKERGFGVLSPQRGVPDTTFVRYYNLAGIYVFLSWVGYEGFGLQPLEAMACGTPVVTSPSVDFAKHLENAYVLPQNYTPHDVVAAVQEISKDKKLGGKLVKAGLETAARYDFSQVIHKFMKEISYE